jgi:hypothetical protein
MSPNKRRDDWLDDNEYPDDRDIDDLGDDSPGDYDPLTIGRVPSIRLTLLDTHPHFHRSFPALEFAGFSYHAHIAVPLTLRTGNLHHSNKFVRPAPSDN